MNNMNLEKGIQRAYYVAWAVSIGIGGIVVNANWPSPSSARITVDHFYLASKMLAFVIGPGVLMYATRWIYRGFVPTTTVTTDARRSDRVQANESEQTTGDQSQPTDPAQTEDPSKKHEPNASLIPLSWAVVCAVISFSVSLVFILRSLGATLSDVSVLTSNPQIISEPIAEAIGYSFGLPLLHVALVSFFKSMRNRSARRKIFIGWAIVVIIANFVFTDITKAQSIKSAVPTKDVPQAQVPYDKAVEQGNSAQTFEQSVAAYKREDYRTAFAGFKKLAEQGNDLAQYGLALMYAGGQGVPKDEQQAVAWFRKAAEQGYDRAQHSMGVTYDVGKWGVPKDEQQAMAWYRKAADQGNASAQGRIAVMYAKGIGVPKDDQQALVWLRKAAEQGDAIAQFTLEAMYRKGEGVPKDDQRAVEWLKKSAEQGIAIAQYNMGVRYATGQGVPKDDQQAVAWYRKAADQGDAGAQHGLGKMYASGRGVPKNDELAAAWVERAAEQGDADAQFLLGGMYATGLGVRTEGQVAYVWLLLASAQGNQDAAKARDLVEADLCTDQRAAAHAVASRWKPKTAVQSSSATR